MSAELRQYLYITGNYWAFTLTDGALRMLVVLYFHQLGFSPLQVASLFLFYEIFGVITNLVGGWLGARIGLNRTMHLGLFLQVLALSMLLVPQAWLTVLWVMAAQALSGIAKDLNKMSAKAGVKLLLPSPQYGPLLRWVAVLTGSKNALKGVGFFLGGLLLTVLGFQGAVGAMAAALLIVGIGSLFFLRSDLGKSKNKPKFREVFSDSRSINVLSAARLCLFGARDVWFVVALPVFLSGVLGWDFWKIGGFMALWIIGYGIVQALSPLLWRGREPGRGSALLLASLLSLIPMAMAALWSRGLDLQTLLITGLLVFGLVFALNSALHSFLILRWAREDGASLDVGFYYMANALGRLIGTLLSGAVYQWHGMAACLWVSAILLLLTAAATAMLPRE